MVAIQSQQKLTYSNKKYGNVRALLIIQPSRLFLLDILVAATN